MWQRLNGMLLLGLLGAVLAAHVFATYYHWYWTIWWFDIPMHLAGGFLTGMFTLWYFGYIRKDFFVQLSFLERLFMLLGIAALVGVFWEFYELFMDVFLLKHQLVFYLTQLGTMDVMKDLADDLLGALFAFLLIARFRT